MSTTPGVDFDFGVNQHPNERELHLGKEVLFELHAAIQAMGQSPVREVHDDFIVFPL